MLNVPVRKGQVAALPMSVGRHVHPMRPGVCRIFLGCGLLSIIARKMYEKDSIRNGTLVLVDENKRARSVFDLAKLGLALGFSFRAVHVVAHGIAAFSQDVRLVIDTRVISWTMIDGRTPGIRKQAPVLYVPGVRIDCRVPHYP